MSAKMNMPKSVVKDTMGDKVFHIITYVILGLLALIVLYPVYFIIIASISDPDAVLAGKVVLYPVDITFSGYRLRRAGILSQSAQRRYDEAASESEENRRKCL